MAQHNLTGNTGEALAAVYLSTKGYNVRHQNWRHAHWEVDIVDKKKIQNLINAAEEYLYQQPQWKRIQFNVLAITILKGEPVEYFFIEDVYL